MDFTHLKIINQIIERDSKDTSYKFALLKGTIEVIQEYPHYIIEKENEAEMPLGLLIEKWLLYYYPIIDVNLKQKNGERENGLSISFRKTFKELTNYYANKGGLSVFYLDFVRDSIPNEIKALMLNLIKKLRNTITNYPMRYIGNSFYHKDYSIYKPNKYTLPIKDISRKTLIEKLGTFSIPKEFYHSFYYLGSIITGQDSLLLKWADFTVNLYRDENVSHKEVLNLLLTSPTNERAVNDVKKIFNEYKSELRCTWTNASFSKIDIDHMLPYSVYRNNDLWNLVPVKPEINNKKRDKIPCRELLLKRKDLIINNWEIISSNLTNRFFNEVQIDLVGKEIVSSENWEELAFNNLLNKSDYLINIRGYESWNL